MANVNLSPWEINDFSGGVTEHYIGANVPTNRAQIYQNLLPLNNKSVDTRNGSEIDDITNPQIPAGAQRIGTLINYNNSEKLFVHSAKKLYYRNPSAYSTLTGPTGNDVFTTGTTANFVSHAQWNRHLFVTNDTLAINPQKIYKDGSGNYQVRTAGLPPLASAPVITPGAAGVNTYIYAFHYHYTYTIGTEVFEDFGPTFLVPVVNSGDPSVNPNAISAIPVISNGATDNWDTAVIKVFIFRTVNGGATFFKLGEVTNGTTVFNDNFADATIILNEIIYTDGGVLDNDPPPMAKFVHIVNGISYYGHLKIGSEVLPNTWKQGVKDDPDSVPASFEDTLEDELTGISSADYIPMMFCKKHIYRVEGQFDELGRGFVQSIRISDHAGCVSNESIVQAEKQVFWAGNDGFYVSNGYTVMKISDHLNETYRSYLSNLTDSKKIVGRFDEAERRIYWAIQANSSSGEVDSIAVLELSEGVSPEMPIFWLDGGDQPTNFAPTSMSFFNKDFYRADSRGYVFRHDPDILTDPKIDTLVAPSLWNKTTIIWRYKGVASPMSGSSYYRKWASRILLTCKNKTNISIQINAINDDGRVTRTCKEIRWRKNFLWGDEDFVWGDPGCVWNAEGLIEVWRWLPAKSLRVSYLQIEITNAYTIITVSDSLGLAMVDNTANTAVLSGLAEWPTDSVDYFLSFEPDGYTKQYLVTARTPTTLTLQDTENTLPSGNLKWLLKGKRKKEALNLLSYVVPFTNMDIMQKTFETGESGGNE